MVDFFRKPQPLCDFCHHKWKVMLDSSAATANRKVERKRNRKEREKHIEKGNEKGKKKDKDKEKLPRILVHEAGMKEEEMQYKVVQKKYFDCELHFKWIFFYFPIYSVSSTAYLAKSKLSNDVDDASPEEDDDHDDSGDFDPDDDVV